MLGLNAWGYELSLYMKHIGSTSFHRRNKAHKFLLLQCETSIGNNSGSIEDKPIEICMQHGFFGYGRSNGMAAIFVT